MCPRLVAMLYAVMCLVTGACTSDQEPSRPIPEESAYELAQTWAKEGATSDALRAIQVALAADSSLVQQALLDPAFSNGLRDHPEFRTAIHTAAITAKLARLVLVGPDEAGDWLELRGRVVDGKGEPVASAAVKLFATDHRGLYHPSITGDRVPRIFGTVVSDAQGAFSARLIYPGAYPDTRDARHIHINVLKPGMRMAKPGYAVFTDDPLLEEAQNSEQRAEALRIEIATVDGERHGNMVVALR